MKKSLIAGAGVAALAMAAVPFGFASATDITEVTDTLTINIEASCTFDAGTHAYTKTMTANQLDSSFGQTVLTVTCNNAKGYTVGSQMNTLTGPAKAGSGNEEITYSATDLSAAGVGKYSAGYSNVINGGTATTGQVPQSGTLMTSNTMTPAAGDTSTITYKVSTTTNQAAGQYQGTAVYTLTPAS
ncbi:hypothetical protein IKF89_01775 [Candidatus Saccharibacteria bacterium]|nr:hypothetical protein [Candidatus Saccharibacteria bacterium]